jgi:branched-subunit amino acid ABC-type transport system permease component
LINALSLGSVYALFALGFTLIFGVLGVINLSHGAVFMLGAYARAADRCASRHAAVGRRCSPSCWLPASWPA